MAGTNRRLSENYKQKANNYDYDHYNNYNTNNNNQKVFIGLR